MSQSGKPTFSVVVPTHKRPQYLQAALRSILNQTVPPIEVLIVDDAKDQETQVAVSSIDRQSDFPIRYVARAGPQGAGASRQAGSDVATGDWIAYLDDDDVWMPHHIAQLSELTTLSVATACAVPRASFGDATYEVLNVHTVYVPSSRFEMFALGPNWAGSNIAVEASMIRRLQWPTLAKGEDRALLLRLLADGCFVTVGRVPTALLREHEGQRLRRKDRDPFLDYYRSYAPRTARWHHWAVHNLRVSAVTGGERLCGAIAWSGSLVGSIVDRDVKPRHVLAARKRRQRPTFSEGAWARAVNKYLRTLHAED